MRGLQVYMYFAACHKHLYGGYAFSLAHLPDKFQ